MGKLIVGTVVALFVGAASAHAALILDAKFSGTVTTQQNSGFAVGAPISGEFTYDTSLNKFDSFVIGGLSPAGGYSSSAAIATDQYTALYQAQISAAQQGGNINQTFMLDLEAITTFPVTGNATADAISLLTNKGQLTGNLDPSSNFGFTTAFANGTGVQSLNASLSSISVVPEPASLAILAVSVAGLGALRRRA